DGSVLGETKGSFKGTLVHGKVQLYTIGMSGEKEIVEKGNYFAGLKDGRIEGYIFGNLEHVDVYAKGVLKETEYYSPETKKIDHKTIYLSDAEANPRKVRLFFYYDDELKTKEGALKKLGARVEVEAYQVPAGNNFSSFYDGAYKRYYLYDGKETLKEEGAYTKNRRNGEWKSYFENDVMATRKYENDFMVSEQFSKDGKAFTGIAEEKSITGGVVRTSIEVKNGLREGKTLDSYTRDANTKEWKSQRTIEYAAGKSKDINYDYLAFLKTQKVVKEVEYIQECDSKGSGLLYLDKIVYTDKGAFAYFHTVNTTFPSGSSIYTVPPGDKDAFSAYDLNTKKVYTVNKIFNMALAPARQSAAYGEMNQFVLYFEGMTQTVKKISFVEGDPENPFEIDNEGKTTYKWGCYEVSIK
ncbi:MAG: hypothetical protein SFU27_05265, partial [Thermonemataceae bacterium]|nr:hypothetical protein [Thermonemataceae bacterium]